MAAITAAIAVGAIAAGGAIAGSMAAKSAAKDAKHQQNKALDQLEYINIDDVSDKALAADRKRFEEQFKLQKDVDPTVAGLREEGAKGVLDGLQDNEGANSLLEKLTQEGENDSPKRQAIIDQLIDSAQNELNSGATLPPEFQAELVRSGLEKTGAAGTTGSGAAGVEARTLLGSAGINLQAQRRSQASQLLSTADALKQNRAAILANTLGSVENAKGLTQARNMNAYQIGAAGVPQAGLNGADVTNLGLANLNQKNQAALARGNINANYALAKGAANQQMIAGITSAATGTLGALLPANGGGGGGIGSMIGANNGYSTPQYNSYAQPNAYGYTSYGRGNFATV